MKNNSDLLRICIGAAFADGEVQDSEKKVLFDLAPRFGLSMAEFSEIWAEFTGNNKPKVHLPKEAEDKKKLLDSLLKVVLADQEVTRNEDRFLRRIAEKLGLIDEIDRQQQLWGQETWPIYG